MQMEEPVTRAPSAFRRLQDWLDSNWSWSLTLTILTFLLLMHCGNLQRHLNETQRILIKVIESPCR